MEKTVISLMCKNIKEKHVDVNELVKCNPKEAISFMHDQYLCALRQLKDEKAEIQS